MESQDVSHTECPLAQAWDSLIQKQAKGHDMHHFVCNGKSWLKVVVNRALCRSYAEPKVASTPIDSWNISSSSSSCARSFSWRQWKAGLEVLYIFLPHVHPCPVSTKYISKVPLWRFLKSGFCESAQLCVKFGQSDGADWQVQGVPPQTLLPKSKPTGWIQVLKNLEDISCHSDFWAPSEVHRTFLQHGE